MEQIDLLTPLAGLAFHKMTGTGNDFILIDNRDQAVQPEVMSLLARALCARRRSAGADGLILLEPSARVDSKLGAVDFRWDFFNADGSSAEMCGNGGRCAARLAHDLGLAGASMVFDTLAGPIRAWVQEDVVKLEMVSPSGVYADLLLEVQGQPLTLEGINTGVPHAVLRVAEVDDLELDWLRGVGRAIRFHPYFGPAGTNVNFASLKEGELAIRTYERGVEDETLACGTGAVAAALCAGRGLGLKPPVTVRVRSGETLKVYFEQQGQRLGDVFLEGATSYVYKGELDPGAFAWLRHQ